MLPSENLQCPPRFPASSRASHSGPQPQFTAESVASPGSSGTASAPRAPSKIQAALAGRKKGA
ncbi:MAG: hypothetical protein ACK46X_03965 [Candidatus Sericytochromatia bacterium]